MNHRSRVDGFSFGAALYFAALLALPGLAPGATREDDVDTIVRAHVAARGGAARLAQIHSLAFYGSAADGGEDSRPHLIKMKPHYSLAGCSAPDCGYAEGFDGRTAWEAQPRRQRAYVARGEAAKAIRRAGAIDFPFLPGGDAATVAYAGVVDLDGKPAQRLDVRRGDGLAEVYYLDPDSHLVRANDRTVPLHARPPAVPQRTYFSDWRVVAGVLYPFALETRRLNADGTTGAVIESGHWARIAANTVDDSRTFAAPRVAPGPLTQLVLDLYAHASGLDAARILGRYRAFRAEPAHAAIDSESDLTWLGYELLKDGAADKALAVLAQLVAEHANSSSAWDSLGDGRLQAGDRAGAIAAFRRAVALDVHADESAAKLAELIGTND